MYSIFIQNIAFCLLIFFCYIIEILLTISITNLRKLSEEDVEILINEISHIKTIENKNNENKRKSLGKIVNEFKFPY